MLVHQRKLNQKPHVDKNLRKAIMKRSQLKNKAKKTKQLEDITKETPKFGSSTKQRIKNPIFWDNTAKNPRPFWDKCKPYFSNKCAHGDFRIILIEKENITNKNEVVQRETLLVNSHEIAKTLNNHFSETRKVKYI